MNLQRLKLMRAAARVERFHVTPTLHCQTVGEHSFGVMTILFEVAEKPSFELIIAALVHDAPEVLTGDIPAPTMWEHPVLKEAMGHVEHMTMLKFNLDHIAAKLTDKERNLLRFADSMECVLFAIEEATDGNRKMATVAWRSLDAIRKRGLVELTLGTMHLYEFVWAHLEFAHPRGTGEGALHGWPE